jgi:hypothetical protein
MALSPAQRLALGLDEPPAGMEFATQIGQPLPGAAPVREPPNLKLILKEGEKATGPRIRTLVNEIIAGNIDNANFWLQQVAASNPERALKILIELAEFSLPKLKAVAVQISDPDGSNPRKLSFAELQKSLVDDQ